MLRFPPQLTQLLSPGNMYRDGKRIQTSDSRSYSDEIPRCRNKFEEYLNINHSTSVVVQSGGSLQMLYRKDYTNGSEEQFDLTDTQTRTLGRYLAGTYCTPVPAKLSEESARREHIE